MKKYNGANINRNSNILFNMVPGFLTNNGVDPDILIGQMWINEEHNNPGVNIIELNSSIETESQSEQDENRQYEWNNVNNSQSSVDIDEIEYRINGNARERRRKKIEAENSYAEYFDSIYAEFAQANWYNLRSNVTFDGISDTHQNNARYLVDSDTSTEPDYYNDVEIIKSKLNLKNDYSKYYTQGIDNCDQNVVTNNDNIRETTWIYPENIFPNNYDLVNIPETESIENSLSANDQELTRLGTPIPALPCTSVPILNLSMIPNLPTVTEISEPIEKSSNETVKSDKATNKMLNISTTKILKNVDKTTSVINWMALSPRQKRMYKMRNGLECQLPTVREVSSYAEDIVKVSEETNTTQCKFLNSDANDKQCNILSKEAYDTEINIKSDRQQSSSNSTTSNTSPKLKDNWIIDMKNSESFIEIRYVDKKDISTQVEMISDDILTTKLSCVSKATQYEEVSQNSFLLQLDNSSNYSREPKTSIVQLFSCFCCYRRKPVNNER